MRPLIPLLAAALILAACTRPLAPGERALAGDVFGPSLNTDTIRVAAGTGFTPRPRKQLNPDRGRPAPRPGICDRAAPQAQDGPPPAFTILHVIHIAEDYYADDIASGWAQTVHLPQALILTHELAHVWQWQKPPPDRLQPAQRRARKSDQFLIPITTAPRQMPVSSITATSSRPLLSRITYAMRCLIPARRAEMNCARSWHRTFPYPASTRLCRDRGSPGAQ